MAKIITSFAAGAGFASAWWSLAISPHYVDGRQWIIPSLATVTLLLGVSFWICINWEE